MLDVTVVGWTKRRQVLTRGGREPGDDVYVTGSDRRRAAGLQMLRASSNAGSTLESCRGRDICIRSHA